MAIPVVISGGIAVYQGIQQLSSGGKEPERLQDNEDAYNAAIAGDLDALAFLLQRSGTNGVRFVSGYGEIGGWATDTAKADALAKYNAAKAAVNVLGVAGGIVSSTQAQTLAQATGNTIVPGTTTDITIVIVVVAAALFLLAKKR